MQLRRVRARYDTLLRSPYIGILVVDRNGKVVEANDTVLSAIGRSQSDLVAERISWLDQSTVGLELREEPGAAFERLRIAGFVPPWRMVVPTGPLEPRQILATGAVVEGEDDLALFVALDISPLEHTKRVLRIRDEQVVLAAELSRRFIDVGVEAMDALFAQSLERICVTYGADMASLYEYDSGEREAECKHWWASPEARARRGDRAPGSLRLEAFPKLSERLVEGEAVLASDPDAAESEGLPDVAKWIRDRAVTSVIVIPVVRRGAVKTLLSLVSLDRRPEWSGDTLATLGILGNMLANALDRQREESERSARGRAMRLIAGLAAELVHLPADRMDAAIDEALSRVGEVVEADGCAVYLVNSEHTRARLAHVWSPAYISRRKEFEIVALGPVEWAYSVLRSGRMLAIADTLGLENEAGDFSTILRPFGVRSVALVPMTLDGEVIGFCGYVWMGHARTDLPRLESTLRLLSELLVGAEGRKRKDRELRELHASLEHRVLERTAQLETMNRELGAFSYSVSHDLRSPLRSINGFAQMLREDHGHEMGPGALELLDSVGRATRRMDELIDALLSLARISRVESVRELVDLSAIAEDILAAIRREDPSRAVSCLVEPGLRAVGDPRLLRIVLDNLLRNAWKFTRRTEGAAIRVGVEERDGRSRFYVRDNGAGFDPTHAGKLFGTFQRLHHESEFEGHGVGLATVLRIVRMHGGDVSADGRVNQGATFWFNFSGAASPPG